MITQSAATNDTTERQEITLYNVGSAQVRWSLQYNAYVVYWFGDHQHGGCHFDRDDAYDHAMRLATAPDWDVREWLTDLALVAEYTDWLQAHNYGPVAS